MYCLLHRAIYLSSNLYNRITAINVRINFIIFFSALHILGAWCMRCVYCAYCELLFFFFIAWPLHMRKWTFALSDLFCRIQINCSLVLFFFYIFNSSSFQQTQPENMNSSQCTTVRTWYVIVVLRFGEPKTYNPIHAAS